MPRLLKLKLLRGSRKSSASSAELPVKTNHSKKSGIFRQSSRSGANARKSDTKLADNEAPAIIVPAITFSMSEDEESSDIVHSPVSDIENQVPFDEEAMSSEIAVGPDTPMSTQDASVGTDESDTLTFTHLEVMRNELAHMRQLAEKDQQIQALRKTTEYMQATHSEEVDAKNAHITNIEQALASVEAALAESKEELASVNQDHSKAIEVLMKTQYELYELKHSNQGSWMAPALGFFDLN